MPISQYGSLNTAAIVVPDRYVQIVPPAALALPGAPSNTLGVIGSASWGPVNQPVVLGTPVDCTRAFGPLAVRKHDLGTHVAIAAMQGANSFLGVRVTDGTDTAASATVPAAALSASTAFFAALALAINAGIGVNRGASALVSFNAATGIFAALYTGSNGNNVVISVGPGSKTGTMRAVASLGGGTPEVYDNIVATGTVPSVASFSLAGGTDGAAGVTAQMLVGNDGAQPRTGMYALRGTSAAVAVLADADDSTTWLSQATFGLSEAIYMVMTGPSGDTIADTVSVKSAAGVDNYAAKLMFGDWLYWSDATNGVTRLVSPAAFAAGELAALAPNQSSLNKQLGGIIASQSSGSGAGAYSTAELSALIEAGIDVICNPAPGGAYWACRSGHNTSSDSTRYGDQYTRMSFFLADTIDAGTGIYVGQPISLTLLQNIRSALLGTLSNLQGQGLLGTVGSSTLPYSVVCDASNNPQAREGLGYVQADVGVQLQGINEKFLVNLQDGATVVIASAASQSVAA